MKQLDTANYRLTETYLYRRYCDPFGVQYYEAASEINELPYEVRQLLRELLNRGEQEETR